MKYFWKLIQFIFFNQASRASAYSYDILKFLRFSQSRYSYEKYSYKKERVYDIFTSNCLGFVSTTGMYHATKYARFYKKSIHFEVL